MSNIRVDREVHQPQVVTQAEYEADLQRGYAILVWSPEREETIKDRRTGKTAKRKIPAVLNYRCMACQFDSTNEDLLKAHRTREQHPWPYDPFHNPYGHIADVMIEGIEDYSQLSQQGEQE